MNYGVAFHRENFHKWLDSHAYEVLKKNFQKEIIHKLSQIHEDQGSFP